jgi:hypothetical protein
MPEDEPMVPGIDPKIDYAFKRVFGREQNKPLLIHLLNAVLQPPPAGRVVSLEILNPFNEKEALDDGTRPTWIQWLCRRRCKCPRFGERWRTWK